MTAIQRQSDSSAARELTIGEVSEQLGMTSRAARFYEAQGLIAPRRERQARYYSISQVKRLETIRALRRFGFTVSEIRELLQSSPGDHEYPLTAQQCADQIAFLKRRLKEIDEAIAELGHFQASLPTIGSSGETQTRSA